MRDGTILFQVLTTSKFATWIKSARRETTSDSVRLINLSCVYVDKNLAVFKLLIQIPEGNVVTYGQISDYLGLRSPRLVGRILHNNPDPEKYPCHRVVFADGSLAPQYAFGGWDTQKEKLTAEGATFRSDKVDMELCRYTF